MIKFSLKVRETAKCIAKAIKDLVIEEPTDDLYIEKIIAEAQKSEDSAAINRKSHARNK